MPNKEPRVKLAAAIHRLVDSAGSQVHGDELVVAVIDEATALITARRPHGGTLSGAQLAYLIESGAFTSEEFEGTEESVRSGDLARQIRQTRLGSAADSLSIAEVSSLLGAGTSIVRRRRAAGTLYAFLVGNQQRFPKWQFAAAPHPTTVPGLRSLISAFPIGAHPATLQGFMTTPQSGLLFEGERMTPPQWLLAGGDPQAVVNILDSYLQS